MGYKMDTDDTEDNEDSEHMKPVSETELMTIVFRMREYKILYEQACQHYQTMVYLGEKSRLRGNALRGRNKILCQKIEDEIRYSKCLQYDISQREETLCKLRRQLQQMEHGGGGLATHESNEPINSVNNNFTRTEKSTKDGVYHNVIPNSIKCDDKRSDLKEMKAMKKLESIENVTTPAHQSKLLSKKKQSQRNNAEELVNRCNINDTVQPTSNHPLVNGTEDEQCFNPTYNEHKSSSIQGCKEMEITMTIDISETSHHTHEESLQEEIINVDKDEISMRTSKEPINDNMLNGNLSSEKSMETSNGKINGNIFTAESNEKL